MANKSLKTSDRKPSGVTHNDAYSKIRHREDCLSTIGDHSVHAQVNSRTLNSMVESASLRTTPVYNWETGTFSDKKMDVLDNARRHITSLKTCTVTSGRHDKKDDTNKLYGVGMAVPSVTTSRRKRGY